MQCMQPPFYKESNPPPLFSSLFLIPPLWTSFSYPPSSARSSLALPLLLLLELMVNLSARRHLPILLSGVALLLLLRRWS